MNWSRIGNNRWVASEYLERVNNVYLPIVITSPAEPSSVLAVEPYSQNDPRWRNNRLGTSGTTIGWNGCLITCVAMVMSYYMQLKDAEGTHSYTTPAILNNWLTQNNGYSDGNLFNWNSIPILKISTWVDCLLTPAPLSQIDACLGRGEPVIVHVDFYPSTNRIDDHYVLIIGKLGADDYVMIDSWDGHVGSFKQRYISPERYIFRIVSYRRN